ncbi:MAG: hypothetical protein ACI8PZ_004101 [Myxococcota bacterium]
MVLLVLSALLTAEATEIGTTRKVGAGVALGTPTSVTGKLFLTEGSGIVAAVDYEPVFRTVGVRGTYEGRLARFGEWQWGAFDLMGKGSAVVHTGGAHVGGVTRLGGGGGLGLAVLLADTPLEIYNELQVMVYPVSVASGAYWAPGMVGVNGSLGVRYYW